MPNATAGSGVDVSALLQDAGIIGLWTYDVARGLFFSDRTMAVAYGVDPSLAATGVRPDLFRRVIHPDDVQAVIRAISVTIADGVTYNVRYRILDQDDAIMHIDSRGRPFISNGRTISVTGANFDVTPPLQGAGTAAADAGPGQEPDLFARHGWTTPAETAALISGSQLRAARGLLRWSVAQLSDVSMVPCVAIGRLERHDGVTRAAWHVLRPLRAHLEAAGVVFEISPEGRADARMGHARES